jgi:hypothetical protein
MREAPSNYGEKTLGPAEPDDSGKDRKHFDKLGLQVGPLQMK